MTRQEEAEETYLGGKSRAGGVGAWHQRASAQEELEKEQWPAEGPRASSDWEMLRVSVCASDFSSQRKKSGRGESFEGPLFANCVNAI